MNKLFWRIQILPEWKLHRLINYKQIPHFSNLLSYYLWKIVIWRIVFRRRINPFNETLAITKLIITIIISSNVIGASAALYFTNHSVQLWSDSWLLSDTCNRTFEAANHAKSTQLNPPITELITITIATTTYPGKKTGKFLNFKL